MGIKIQGLCSAFEPGSYKMKFPIWPLGDSNFCLVAWLNLLFVHAAMEILHGHKYS